MQLYSFYEVLGSDQSLPSTLKMGTELVLETSEHFNILPRPLARENFIEFSRRENIKTYSSFTLSLTSEPDGGGWLTPRLGRFTPGKETRYPLYRRLGGPRARVDGC